jgi:hypothetical protein
VIAKELNTLAKLRREFMPKSNMKQILSNMLVLSAACPFVSFEIRSMKFVVVMLLTPGPRDFALI